MGAHPRLHSLQWTHGGLPHGDVLQATQDLHGCRKVSVLVARFRNQQKFGQQRHLQLKWENGPFSVLQLRRMDGGEHSRTCGKNPAPGPKEACAPPNVQGAGRWAQVRAGGWAFNTNRKQMPSVQMCSKLNVTSQGATTPGKTAALEWHTWGRHRCRTGRAAHPETRSRRLQKQMAQTAASHCLPGLCPP